MSPFIVLFYEFCGTAFLTYTFSLSPNHDPKLRGLAYMISFIIAFTVSGALFNPATSLAVFLSEKNWKMFAAFIATILA